MADATGTADAGLGRTAYEAETAWLDEIMPGGPVPSWDRLDPEHQGVYQRLAGAVAAAERERLAGLVKARADEMAAEAANAPGPDGVAVRARAEGMARAARLIGEAGQ